MIKQARISSCSAAPEGKLPRNSPAPLTAINLYALQPPRTGRNIHGRGTVAYTLIRMPLPKKLYGFRA
jgi:hypothetical protein